VAAEQWKEWKRLGGSSFGTMCQGPEEAERFIREANPELRRLALAVLDGHWGPGPDFPAICEAMLQDSDEGVRVKALSCLGNCYAGTRNVRIARLFAGMVLDESKPYDFRCVAYLGLLDLHERSPSPDNMLRLARREFRIPQDTDRGFVQGFL